MKVWLQYIGVFGTGFLLFFVLINATHSPEQQILGEWKEMAWEYEMVDKADNDITHYSQVSDYVKNSMGQSLVIHKAEVWTFMPQGKLKLSGNDREETVTWRMKGRGHILELKHEDNTIEHYNLTELDNNKMVLNFDSDMQVRGVAKLTFEKL